MRRVRPRLLSVLLGCALAAAGCERQASSGTPGERPTLPAGRQGAERVALGTTVGLRAPSIELPTLSGRTVTLDSLRGKVVLVNFWATWCGPCLMEMPSMQRLYEQFGREEFEILAVSSDFDGAAVVKPYVDRLRLTFPILLDAQFQANSTYRVTGLPTTVIVDRDGIITHKFFGSRDWDNPDSHRLITQLLRART
ncbi:MAG: TlpA disulfide reductase family protein [Nitrospirota bacterium]